jgi:hypothetical protein
MQGTTAGLLAHQESPTENLSELKSLPIHQDAAITSASFGALARHL